MTQWFEDMPILGKMQPAQAAARLRELGDSESAAALETGRETETFGTRRVWPSQDRPWRHTSHAFRYLGHRHLPAVWNTCL